MDMREAPLVGAAVGARNGRTGGAEGAEVFTRAGADGAVGLVGYSEGGAEVFNLSEPGQTHLPTSHA